MGSNMSLRLGQFPVPFLPKIQTGKAVGEMVSSVAYESLDFNLGAIRRVVTNPISNTT